MLSHAHGWHDLLRSRRRDSRGRWLQRLVRPNDRQTASAELENRINHYSHNPTLRYSPCRICRLRASQLPNATQGPSHAKNQYSDSRERCACQGPYPGRRRTSWCRSKSSMATTNAKESKQLNTAATPSLIRVAVKIKSTGTIQ
jgi:hypothetical protein